MDTPIFDGRQALISCLDAAVQQQDVEKVTRVVERDLKVLIQDGVIRLNDELRRPMDGCYARRRLCLSEEHGYVVIAMIWGPGQGTLLHDHDGVWCVEGVLEGEIEVTQYDALETGDCWRFEQQQTIRAAVGSSGSLIPPFEYHTLCNAHGDRAAITLHVYGREMHQAHVFEPLGGGLFERQRRELSYSN